MNSRYGHRCLCSPRPTSSTGATPGREHTPVAGLSSPFRSPFRSPYRIIRRSPILQACEPRCVDRARCRASHLEMPQGEQRLAPRRLDCHGPGIEPPQTAPERHRRSHRDLPPIGAGRPAASGVSDMSVPVPLRARRAMPESTNPPVAPATICRPERKASIRSWGLVIADSKE